jgi:hypothetical protein
VIIIGLVNIIISMIIQFLIFEDMRMIKNYRGEWKLGEWKGPNGYYTIKLIIILIILIIEYIGLILICNFLYQFLGHAIGFLFALLVLAQLIILGSFYSFLDKIETKEMNKKG